jgi:hypothetical protein
LEKEKETAKETEKERGVTLRRGGREMGEAMDREKTAYTTGVVLDFKNLQLFIQDGDEAAPDPTNGPQTVHFNSSYRIASGSNRSTLKEKMGRKPRN